MRTDVCFRLRPPLSDYVLTLSRSTDLACVIIGLAVVVTSHAFNKPMSRVSVPGYIDSSNQLHSLALTGIRNDLAKRRSSLHSGCCATRLSPIHCPQRSQCNVDATEI